MGLRDVEEQLEAAQAQSILDERTIAAQQATIVDLVEAIRLTQEYAQLPAVEGWSWYDTLRRHAPEVAEQQREAWQGTQ